MSSIPKTKIILILSPRVTKIEYNPFIVEVVTTLHNNQNNLFVCFFVES